MTQNVERPTNNKQDTLVDRLWNYDWSQYIFKYGRCSFLSMSKDDYTQMDKIANMINPKCICEIGSGGGGSTAMWASHAKKNNGMVYAFDSYKPTYFIEHRTALENHMKNLDLSQYVNVSSLASKEANKNLRPDMFFDLIFIDANHQYLSTKEDIDMWYEKVRPGGIICGHDCEIIPTDKDIEKIKKIDRWDLYDMVEWTDPGGIHAGVCVAVAEKFKNKVQKLGNRIWMVKND